MWQLYKYSLESSQNGQGAFDVAQIHIIFFPQESIKALDAVEKKTNQTQHTDTFFFFPPLCPLSNVLEMHSTSLAVERSILALACTSSSAGEETQQTLRYRLPAEEIRHGATRMNLCHILSVFLNSVNSVQLS